MSINFPSSPAVGQTFTAEGRTFRWTGAVWLMQAKAVPWASLDDMDAATAPNKIVHPAGFKHLLDGYAPDQGLLYLRAWARFDGISGAIQASFNVSGVTLQGTSSYRIDFAAPLPDAFYVIQAKTDHTDANPLAAGVNVVDAVTAAAAFLTTGATGGSNSVWTPQRGRVVHFAAFHPQAA